MSQSANSWFADYPYITHLHCKPHQYKQVNHLLPKLEPVRPEVDAWIVRQCHSIIVHTPSCQTSIINIKSTCKLTTVLWIQDAIMKSNRYRYSWGLIAKIGSRIPEKNSTPRVLVKTSMTANRMPFNCAHTAILHQIYLLLWWPNIYLYTWWHFAKKPV